MRAWYMDADTTADQRAPHEQAPPAPCSLETLAAMGVLYWHLDATMCVRGGAAGPALRTLAFRGSC